MVACSASLLLLAASAGLAAQQSGSGEGRYGTRNFVSEVTELPDGRTLTTNHFYQATFADDPNDPLDNLTGQCVGQMLASPEGVPITGSGICYSKDSDGDGVSWWWRQETGATAECPNICGVFGYLDGYGKYEGITGGGSWQVTAAFEEGGLGAWQATYEIP